MKAMHDLYWAVICAQTEPPVEDLPKLAADTFDDRYGVDLVKVLQEPYDPNGGDSSSSSSSSGASEQSAGSDTSASTGGELGAELQEIAQGGSSSDEAAHELPSGVDGDGRPKHGDADVVTNVSGPGRPEPRDLGATSGLQLPNTATPVGSEAAHRPSATAEAPAGVALQAACRSLAEGPAADAAKFATDLVSSLSALSLPLAVYELAASGEQRHAARPAGRQLTVVLETLPVFEKLRVVRACSSSLTELLARALRGPNHVSHDACSVQAAERLLEGVKEAARRERLHRLPHMWQHAAQTQRDCKQASAAQPCEAGAQCTQRVRDLLQQLFEVEKRRHNPVLLHAARCADISNRRRNPLRGDPRGIVVDLCLADVLLCRTEVCYRDEILGAGRPAWLRVFSGWQNDAHRWRHPLYHVVERYSGSMAVRDEAAVWQQRSIECGLLLFAAQLWIRHQRFTRGASRPPAVYASLWGVGGPVLSAADAWMHLHEDADSTRSPRLYRIWL